MKNITNQDELKILEFWNKNKIYEKVKEKNKGNKLFNHIDGPPYPTGDAHLGHLRVWSIKDCVLRFRRAKGYEVYARDGYDVHGLPVENKVQKKLKLKTVDDLKKFGEDNFVKECKKYVSEIIDEMSSLRSRFGLWMDRDYYHTAHPNYLSMAWKFFKIAQEKGLLYKDYKTVAWCPNDETTLSDYEIKDEYTTLEDPSIYVKFPIRKNFRETEYKESLVIWTTTPWTLQSNMAIAMNPKYNYSYVLVKIEGKEEVLILAESLVENVIEIISKSKNIKFIKILKTKKGAEFEGIKYEHIYLEETPSQQEFLKNELKHKHIHSVILADYVTLDEGEDVLEKLEKKGNYKHTAEVRGERKEEGGNLQPSTSNHQSPTIDGTGLVHIAPGHGFDDYEVGKKYNLPIFCPVGPNGKFTEGKFKGKYFKEVDNLAISYLKQKNFLLHSSFKSHRYPCCWRCKTPIVYRAADQWWIKRSKIIEEVIKANSNVKWYPEFAKQVFNNLYERVGDWPISRQRYWGIPLPIFEDEDGNYEVFGSREELEKRIGKKLKDIHRDDLRDIIIKNKISGKKMSAVPFITDVWFESGCASFAAHYGEGLSFEEIIEKYYPIKWIIEGQDQIRGWFSSLFSVGYVVTGKAPYNEVVYQQFVMDKVGKKMSKSLGNGLTGNEAIEKFGADKTRYYLLSKRATEDQINFDEEDFKLIDGMLNTLENLSKFMNSYVSEFEIRYPTLNISNLDVEDKWILYKLNIIIQKFEHNMENYKIHLALSNIEEFLVKDLSKTYLKIVKGRTEERDENLIVIFEKILKNILILFSFSIPYVTEKIYQESSLFNKKESIFLENFPQVDKLLIKDVESKKIGENFELAQEIIASILNAREKAKIGVRWPLGEIDLISTQNLKLQLAAFEKLIKKLTNILKIKYDSQNVGMNYIIKPNFALIKQDFSNIQEVIKVINLNKFYISEDLKSGEKVGTYENIKLDLEKHIIKEVEIIGEFISSEFNGGNVILHTHQDEILLEEGYLRELIRRVQQARKELKLNKKDKINLSFYGSDKYFINEIVLNWSSLISKKVGAEEILKGSLKNKQKFEIKGKELIIFIEKL